METLSIDIETYSDVPLQKTGVYRYVESSNFEILLFAYSADSQPVRVIDLACGEQIPKEVLLALADESVIKWAFNAAFEHICLSRFLGYPTGEYEIADEIFRLRELRQKTTVDTAARDEQINRINDLQDYIAHQTTHLTEFDESMVRRWIKQITIWDDHITVELKSGVSIDVDA